MSTLLPRGLLVARVYRDQVRPQFLGEDQRGMAEGVLTAFRRSKGRPRREVERQIREIEEGARSYKIVRALALLVERESLFRIRPGPPPAEVRRRIFDAHREPAVTPGERHAALTALGRELAMDPEAAAVQMWADLEEEEILEEVRAPEAPELLRRFNMGQCQTLLFRASQINVSFDTTGVHRTAIARIRRLGLMFTAQEGPPPLLRIEGVVSFLHGTERYGAALARLLPILLPLPGWKLEAQIAHAGSDGRKRSRTLRLDPSVESHLGVEPEEAPAPGPPPSLEPLVRLAAAAGLRVDPSPKPHPAETGLLFPDLVVSGRGKEVAFEAVGFWSREWLEGKLARTARLHPPYLIVTEADFAVTKSLAGEGQVALGRGKAGPEEVWQRVLAQYFGSILPPARRRHDVKAADLVLASPVCTVESIARSADVDPATAVRLLEERGYLCGGGFAVQQDLVPRIRSEVRGALPSVEKVERVLAGWSLSTAMLEALGFTVRWHGLVPESVEER